MIEPRVEECKRCNGSGTIAVGKKRDTHLICGCRAGRMLASALFKPRAEVSYG